MVDESKNMGEDSLAGPPPIRWQQIVSKSHVKVEQ